MFWVVCGVSMDRGDTNLRNVAKLSKCEMMKFKVFTNNSPYKNLDPRQSKFI